MTFQTLSVTLSEDAAGHSKWVGSVAAGLVVVITLVWIVGGRG